MQEQQDFFNRLGDEPEPVEPISPEFEVIEPPVNHEIPKPKKLPVKPIERKETPAQKIAREKEEKIRKFQEREQERKDIWG